MFLYSLEFVHLFVYFITKQNLKINYVILVVNAKLVMKKKTPRNFTEIPLD